MIEAVLAIEDRRFYDHVGVDPIGIASAVWDYVSGRKQYLRGGSTLTQQLVKNTFLTQERSPIRKMQDQFMALILERRLTKDQVLELYLNDVWLGQRGSFAVHGVPEASRLFFAKDVSNVSLSEAATIAGVIQSPPRLSPFVHPERAKERRNVVLKAMAEAGLVSAEAAERASQEPVQIVARALEAEAPYFVDYISQELQDKYSAVGEHRRRLHDARPAPAAHRAGRRPRRARARRRAPRQAQAAEGAGGAHRRRSAHGRDPRDGRRPVLQPVAVQPRHQRRAGSPARCSSRSSTSPRSSTRTRRAAPTSRPRRSSSTSRRPSCSTTEPWTPGNYENEYDGPDHAAPRARPLAQHRHDQGRRNDRLRQSRRALAAGRRGHVRRAPTPSIALGVFEATPFEIATAYTLFPNGGTIRPLRAISRLVSGGQNVQIRAVATKTVARRDTTFLVTNMMRSVLNEGTGAPARGPRASRSTPPARPARPTTCATRGSSASPRSSLTVVWVGLDDNQPLGLSGATGGAADLDDRS